MFWCSVKQKQSLRREMEDLDSCQTLNRQLVVRPSEPLLSAAIFIQGTIHWLHLFDFSPLSVLKYGFHPLCVFKFMCVIKWTRQVVVSVRPSGSRFHSRHEALEDTIAHQEVTDYIVKYNWQILLSNTIGKYFCQIYHIYTGHVKQNRKALKMHTFRKNTFLSSKNTLAEKNSS